MNEVTTHESPKRLRFGILEMMLVTAGIAVIIAVGWQSLFMIRAGIGLALALGLAAFISRNANVANIVSPLALAGLTLTDATDMSPTNPIPITALIASICLVFAFFGSRWRRLRRSQTTYRRPIRYRKGDSIQQAFLP